MSRIFYGLIKKFSKGQSGQKKEQKSEATFG
jgi:hypothetical protein